MAETEFLRDHGGRVDGGSSAEQGADPGHPGDCVYPGEVGHHHPQGGGAHLHPARQTHDLCKWIHSSDS